jgi:hypothetical protein
VLQSRVVLLRAGPLSRASHRGRGRVNSRRECTIYFAQLHTHTAALLKPTRAALVDALDTLPQHVQAAYAGAAHTTEAKPARIDTALHARVRKYRAVAATERPARVRPQRPRGACGSGQGACASLVILLSSSCHLTRTRGRSDRDTNATAPVHSFAPDTGWPALEGVVHEAHPDRVRALAAMSGAEVQENVRRMRVGRRGHYLEAVRGDACS